MKLLYAPGAKEAISRLPPEIKKLIRHSLESLREDPYQGKALQRELSGFYSLRIKHYRAIFKILAAERIVRIYNVGPRKTIYEDFLKSLSKLS